MAFLWVRQSAFAFLGGYMVTSFYNEAIRHKKLVDEMTPAARQQLKKATGKKDSDAMILWGADGTFSDDVRKTIIQYEMASAAALLLMVLAGGIFATLGAVGSFTLEGPSGPETYAQLKKKLPSWAETEELTHDAVERLKPLAQEARDKAGDLAAAELKKRL